MIRREGIDKIRLDIGVDWAIPSPLLFLPQTEPSPHPTSVLAELSLPLILSLLFLNWAFPSFHLCSLTELSLPLILPLIYLRWAIPSLLNLSTQNWDITSHEPSPHSEILGHDSVRLSLTHYESLWLTLFCFLAQVLFWLILTHTPLCYSFYIYFSIVSLLMEFYCFPFYIHFSIVFHLWKPPLQNLYKPPIFPPKEREPPIHSFPHSPSIPFFFLVLSVVARKE